MLPLKISNECTVKHEKILSKKKKKQNVSDPQNVAASLRKGKANHHRQ